MDPQFSRQDILRCGLCKNGAAALACGLCHTKLCKACVGEHISDDPINHVIVHATQCWSIPGFSKCSEHVNKRCKFLCKTCSIPVCSVCVTSTNHEGHKFSNLSEIYTSTKDEILKDENELKNIIYPTYEQIVTDTENVIASLDNEYSKIKNVMSNYREEWHCDVDRAMDKLEKEMQGLRSNHLDVLRKHLANVQQTQSLVHRAMQVSVEISETNDVSMYLDYHSENDEFCQLPPKITVTMPKFCPQKVQAERILGDSYLELSTLKTEKHGYRLIRPRIGACSPFKHFLNDPELVATLNTGYKNLRGVACLHGEKFWTCGSNNEIKCFNMQNSNSATIPASNFPSDIAVSNDGTFIFSVWETRAVYRIRNGHTEEMITLEGWKPNNLCVISTGDILISVFNDEYTQSKVVRYSDFQVKQTIQYDSDGNAIYSGNDGMKYLCENRNYDICVADVGARTVVVVDQTGALQFKYKGHPSQLDQKRTFQPFGITTDSQSQILVSDCNNHCVHILDYTGQFLRYLGDCNLKYPLGLCVDRNDFLFIAEYLSGKVKKIKYMECK